MRAKSTTSLAKEHEDYVAAVYEWARGWRSASSGAKSHQPIDVTTDVSVIECEATEKKSYILTRGYWQEVTEKQHSGKIPMLAIRFRDPTTNKTVDLAIMDLHDASALQEEVEAYRNAAIAG